MWNCSAPPSSLLLPFGDNVYMKCESSSSQAGAVVGLDRILAADYDLCHNLNLSQSIQSLQAPTLFPMHGSHSYLAGLTATGSSVYNGDASSPAFAHQFDCTQLPTTHSVKWTAAGETATGGGSRLIRGSSKRLKTTTATAATTAQGPHRGLRCNAKPRNQTVKAPSKRSQKLGDKITALQQLVSPYGKTDTASVLQEAATFIKHLHQQIQILTASYPEVINSPTSQQHLAGEDEEEEEEGAASDLRRRGLCVAPLSPAVVALVSSASGAVRGHRDTAETGDYCWRQLGTL